MSRRAAKVDRNHGEIVNALRAAGAKVLSLAEIGRGVPDLLVKCPGTGELVLVEVKDGRKPPSARGLTPDQVRWIQDWGGGVEIVMSPEQALRAIGAIA